MSDPYRHHPELRGQIEPAEQSFMRQLSLPFLEDMARQHGLPGGWWYSDAEREALRAQDLRGRMDRPLWVFAYGSLMWDPAVRFSEIRRARIQGYCRRFILLEANGGRGTPETPGPLAALDAAPAASCEGLVFCIPPDLLDAETYLLWHREMIAPGYLARFLPAETAQGRVEAVAFVADHAAPDIHPDLSLADQARLIAAAAGIVGSARDYLRKLVLKLDQLGIEDPDTRALWGLVQRQGGVGAA